MNNILEDVLETVRFKSAVYFNYGFCGDWGMDVPSGDFAQFHFVAQGNCIVEVGRELHHLSRGDLVIFPHGDAHCIKVNEDTPCLPGMDVVKGVMNGEDVFSEGAVTTQLVCGHYEINRGVSHFILDDLPEIVIVKNDEHKRYEVLSSVLEMIIDEMSTKQAGYMIVTLRFAEILFVSILRHYYINQSSMNFNLFKDEAIYNSVNYIHNNINNVLSLELLSKKAALSRTLFIERFKKSVGTTPLSYIKTWRMTKARQLLKYSEYSLRDIGQMIGYRSSTSFNRVFKQTFNISPVKYRMQPMEQ